MGKAPTIIYPNEWRLASDMTAVLSPFEEVTQALSEHSASILHGLCSIIKSLHLGTVTDGQDESDDVIAGGDDDDATAGLGHDVAAEARENLCTAARKLAANLSRQLEWHFEPIFANFTFLIATLLDPT